MHLENPLSDADRGADEISSLSGNKENEQDEMYHDGLHQLGSMIDLHEGMCSTL